MKIFSCFNCAGPCRYNEDFCADCEKDFISQLKPRFFGAERLGPISLLAAGNYSGSLARMIKICKSQPFGVQEVLLLRRLKALVAHWRSEMLLFQPDAIVSVPGQPLRSFIQTDLARWLAIEASRELKIPVLPSVLKKTWRASLRRSQKQRTKFDRFAETHSGAFKVSEIPPGFQRILLVDDVCTTGATLLASERALNAAGLGVVGAFVLARVAAPTAKAVVTPFEFKLRPKVGELKSLATH